MYFFEKEHHVLFIYRKKLYTIKGLNKKEVIFRLLLELAREHSKENSVTGYVSGDKLRRALWGNNHMHDNYLAKYVSVLSALLANTDKAFESMIESEKRWGYRLASHPRNIIVNPDIA